MNSNWRHSPETLNSGENWRFCVLCDLKVSWMTLENNRAPLLCYVKATVYSNWSRAGNAQFGQRWAFLFPVTVKFDKWPWKTIGYLFYITSSFMHHFKAMGAFKLALQSGNAQLGTRWAIFVLCDLKFDGWHWKTIGQIFRAASSFVHHSIAISKF